MKEMQPGDLVRLSTLRTVFDDPLFSPGLTKQYLWTGTFVMVLAVDRATIGGFTLCRVLVAPSACTSWMFLDKLGDWRL